MERHLLHVKLRNTEMCLYIYLPGEREHLRLVASISPSSLRKQRGLRICLFVDESSIYLTKRGYFKKPPRESVSSCADTPTCGGVGLEFNGMAYSLRTNR